MITSIEIIEIGVYSTLILLLIGFIVIFKGMKAVLREYLQIRAQIGTLLSENPEEVGKLVKPYVDGLIRQYNINPGALQGGGGMMAKPIKITGNSGLDGLISMFIQSKVLGSTQNTAKPQPEEQSHNPF